MKSTEQAIKVLKELVPFHNDYKEDLVDLYIDVKKYSSALNLLDELDESSNFSNEREKTRFKIYNLSNDFRAKESYLIKQIQKYPKKESYYLKLIVFYSEQNDLENALKTAENLLQVLPNSDRVHLSLYKFNLQQTKIDAAVESLLIVCNSPVIPDKSKIKTLNDFKDFIVDSVESIMEYLPDIPGAAAIARMAAKYALPASVAVIVAYGGYKLIDKALDKSEEQPEKEDEKDITIDVSPKGKHDEMKPKNEIPLEEFIKSMYDYTQNAFPKGETAVLTAVEKDYGEEHVGEAQQITAELLRGQDEEMARIQHLAGLR